MALETCPACNTQLPEFVDSFCPQCGEDLISSPSERDPAEERAPEQRPEDKHTQPEGVETIATYESAVQAERVRIVLEDYGIQSFVEDGDVNTALSYVGSALGGVKLVVAKKDVAKARHTMESIAYEAAKEPAAWFCRDCQERIDGEFQLCWKCGKDREEVEGEIPPSTVDDGGHDLEEVEAKVTRAWVAAFLGLGFLPFLLNFYSMTLLFNAETSDIELSVKSQRRVKIAFIVNLVAICFHAILVKLWLSFA